MMACPNNSINVVTEMVATPDGKKKKQLLRHEYNLGSCMFCMLCVRACPHDAITFDQSFENAVFDRSKLILQLNQPGSRLLEKPARSAVPKAATPAEDATAKPKDKPTAEAETNTDNTPSK